MKIAFTKQIVEEDVIRTGVTVGHIIIYPGSQIVLNNKDGSSRVLLMAGLSAGAQSFFDQFIASITAETKDEYETGAVTARAIAAEALTEVIPGDIIIVK